MASLGTKVVLFGGQDAQNFFSDTWEWDGSTWTQVALSGGPSARSEAVMASLGGKVVLFGGFGPPNGVDSPLTDTWEFDGSAWTQRTPSQTPGPRLNNAMAALGTSTVFFGGDFLNGVTPSDTWGWDGSAWTQLATGGPPPRLAHAMATR
jgi:N-acetylneuraminic acid mutarotase